MSVNEIETLLARYYNGDTTESEEKALKRFFTEEEVPAHLLADKELFMQLASPTEPPVPQGLEARLASLIDQWDTHERRSVRLKRRTRIVRLQWLGSIAASLLLLLAVGTYLHQSAAPAVGQDTCATPEEAYAEARKALLMFSSALNKGAEQMAAVHETTGKMQENVNQQLKRIKKLK